MDLLFGLWANDERKDNALVRLAVAIVGETWAKLDGYRISGDVATIVSHLPVHAMRFFQEVCIYVRLLKINAHDDDRYFGVFENFCKFVTDYLVFLHGVYITKNTTGAPETALSLEEYYGKVFFDSEQEKERIALQYKVVVKVILDRLFVEKTKGKIH